jgi:hypothetical protein
MLPFEREPDPEINRFTVYVALTVHESICSDS